MLGNLKEEKNIYYLDKTDTLKLNAIIRELSKIGKKYNIHEIIPLNTKDIDIAHWVRLKCKYGCDKYGTNWCCPPESPDPEQTKALLDEYEKALLLRTSIKNNQFNRDNSQKRRIQVNSWKGTFALERQLFLAGYYKAFSLVAENCALCKECTYPKACLFPLYRRPSIESCSIDIFQTLKKIGKTFKIAQDVTEEYNSYSIILLE